MTTFRKFTACLGIGLSLALGWRFYQKHILKMSTPACKIFLRHDQRAKHLNSMVDSKITVYGPSFLDEGLKILGKTLKGKSFNLYDTEDLEKKLESFTLSGAPLTLIELQKITRNEPVNTNGIINMSYYSDGGIEDTRILLSLKDLVRQSAIVGRTTATHFGGYPRHSSRVNLEKPISVYVCDLAGLQFQQFYNTGRLVLIDKAKNNRVTQKSGLIDDLIYENVVGEKRKMYEEAKLEKDCNKRYIEVQGFSKQPTLFDVVAYKRFVAYDVILIGLSLADKAAESGDKINLKFLKYGTGFFAGSFEKQTNEHILEGVVLGLEILFAKYNASVSQIIQHVEFPFYQKEVEIEKRLEELKNVYGLNYSFSNKDALEPTVENLVTATTNCGDSLAVIGNEMNFGSVDATIAENLEDKGFRFCPFLNPNMQEKLLDIPPMSELLQTINKPTTNCNIKEKDLKLLKVGQSSNKL